LCRGLLDTCGENEQKRALVFSEDDMQLQLKDRELARGGPEKHPLWGESKLTVKPEPYQWDEIKIGPGAPPIKNRTGMAIHLSWSLSDHGRIGLSFRRRLEHGRPHGTSSPGPKKLLTWHFVSFPRPMSVCT